MKKLFLILSLLLVFLLASCSEIKDEKDNNCIINEQTEASGEANSEKISLSVSKQEPADINEIVERCYCIVIGNLNTIEDSKTVSNVSLLNFSITDTLKGNISENDITLKVYDYSSYEDIFVIGNEYVLPVELHQNIFKGKVYVLDEIVIKINDKSIVEMFQRGEKYTNNNFSNIDDLKSVIKETVGNVTENGPIAVGSKYIESDEVEEIVDFSDFIVRVKITADNSIQYSGTTVSGEYQCEVLENYKGEISKQFYFYSYRDEVTVGKEYLLLLTDLDESKYVISSKNSCIPVSDTESYEEYMKYIGE